MAKEYKTRNAADSAARRALRAIHGPNYIAKAGVDFITSRAPWWGGWRFEIIAT